MTTTSKIDYDVDYTGLDAFKREALEAALRTKDNAKWLGVTAEPTFGESVFVTALCKDMHYSGCVNEGLGTKNLIADAVEELTGRCYYDYIAQDTVAMIVNDMITLRIFPSVVQMHLALGDAKWLDHAERRQKLILGWAAACNASRCIWGGGETPSLRGIICPDAALISGSGSGHPLRDYLLRESSVEAGDAIVFFESSGLHANGATLARDIAAELPKGYLTPLYNEGVSFGEALLTPTHIYVQALAAMMEEGIEIHYAANITGHGWTKLMRSIKELTYVVETLPKQQPLFDFMQEHSRQSDEYMYAKLNMGAGFAVFIARKSMKKFEKLESRKEWAFNSFIAGHVKDGPKRVVIEPKGIEFKGNTLAIR